jgi:hypothetical protein
MRLKLLGWSGAVCLLTLIGCSNGHSHHSNPGGGNQNPNAAGRVASDFQSLADYLNSPVVQSILDRTGRAQGSSPPGGVDGSFHSSGQVTFTTIPGINPGDAVSDDFCFGPPAGAAIEVAVNDPSFVDGGARSFIEGTGDSFTIYTAFISMQGGQNGTCEDHLVLVFTGTVESDGSLTSLAIGFGVVGLVGDCGDLLVGDLQITENTATRTGASCVGSFTPSDPAKVLVNVENFLVTDVEVNVTGLSPILIPLLSAATFEAAPGFQLSFQSVQPPLNLESSPKAQGVVLSGTFPADTQPAGRFSGYSISNVIGGDVFFAPMILNRTAGAVSAVVNVGTPAAFDCSCSLPADPLAQYILGYHPFDVPGTITASQANLRIVTTVPAAEIDIPSADFPILGLDSGAASFIVTPTP